MKFFIIRSFENIFIDLLFHIKIILFKNKFSSDKCQY